MLAQVDINTIGILSSIVISLLMVALTVWNLIYTQSIAARANKIDALEDKLGNTTRQLIDQQLRGISEAYRTAHEAFSRDVHDMRERMARGETKFAILDRKDHELEVKILQELRTLSENVATKADLDRMRKEMGNG